MGMQSMAEDGKVPSSGKMADHPAFQIFALLLAVALVIVAGRYGWKRWKG